MNNSRDSTILCSRNKFWNECIMFPYRNGYLCNAFVRLLSHPFLVFMLVV
jgi:hypothetical protein